MSYYSFLKMKTWKKNFPKKKTPEQVKKEKKESLETAYEACTFNGKVTIKDLSEYMGKSEDTVRRYIKEHGGFWSDGGEVGKK
jgi:predicted transcriptional regulator YheO